MYLSLYLSANFRPVVILSLYQCAHRLSFPLPASSSWGVPCCSLAAPRLLPGLPHCSLACMAAPWLLLAVRLCPFLAAPGAVHAPGRSVCLRLCLQTSTKRNVSPRWKQKTRQRLSLPLATYPRIPTQTKRYTRKQYNRRTSKQHGSTLRVSKTRK